VPPEENSPVLAGEMASVIWRRGVSKAISRARPVWRATASDGADDKHDYRMASSVVTCDCGRSTEQRQ
jgi:hypothetical protein